jgi:hypothetical protein
MPEMPSSESQRAAYEPLHDFDPLTGASIAVFYVGHGLAAAFELRGPGWFWSLSMTGSLSGGQPTGPFTSAYTAYRDALAGRVTVGN